MIFITYIIGLLYSPYIYSIIFGVALLTAYIFTKLRGDNVVISTLRNLSNIGLTYFSSQLILFYATILWVSGRSLHKWKKVEDVRKEFKPIRGDETT
jgi:hypothetical protein